MFSTFSRISVLLLLTLVKWSYTESNEENLEYRLPDDIVPTSYELKIIPNLKDNFDFSGEVTINVRATANTNKVILHCRDLNVTAISISNETEKINQDCHEFIVDKQFLKLTTRSELLKNCEYSIRALFRGSLRDEPVGFYKERWYKRGTGEIKWLATTQLEPIYARTVFPCFDEPHFKTPFSIHIARSENQMSVANMPYIMSKGPEVKIQNRTWDMFESKQSISTYQVAFTVTENSFKPDVGNGVLLGTPNRGNKNIFEVLTKSKVILKELELYTNMSFNKENMHMVAISDFLVGALENVGLLTIKESLIVYSQSKTSKLSKEVIELAAVHEFAHQWFGDYVTPLWWNCTWLKEGFATFMEYKILNTIEPKWKMDELFITDILQQALSQDKNTHPMTTDVQTPSEIINLYDFITYQKGASILKMLEFIVTPSTFKKATQRYLKYGSNKTTVTPDDLWYAINEEVLADKKVKLPTSVKELMRSWTEQPGYPLIMVNVENNDVTIKQEPYAKYSSNATWIIPITYATQTDDLSPTTVMEWLSPYEQLVLDNAVEPGQWIILNLGQTGYYRVNYDYDNWQALTNQLMKDHKLIDPILRAKLIDDALNLAIDEKLNYNTALSLLRYFPQEKHYLPQISILYNLKNLYLKFEQTSIESPLKLFISELITRLYNYLGPSNGFFDNHITHRIRKDVVYLACKVGIEKCQRSTASLFYKQYKHLEKIDENLKPAVFCMAIETLQREDFVFDNLLKFYNKTNNILDRELVINSFACLNNTAIIKRILSRNITVLRNRDLQKAIDIVLRSGKNSFAITEYIRTVLASINGNVIPGHIEANLKYIIRNMKIVNIVQLRALNALLHEVKELERFHSILNALVDRSQNATVYNRETERAAREVNETLNEFINSQNESRKFDCFLHPVKYFKNKFKDSHKISNGILKMKILKNNVGNYFEEKIKNISKYVYDVLRIMNRLSTVPLPERNSTEILTSTVADLNVKPTSSNISGSKEKDSTTTSPTS